MKEGWIMKKNRHFSAVSLVIKIFATGLVLFFLQALRGQPFI